ncbi:23568_t:CDS:1, partial [Dentiscutata erythropus]
KAHKEARNQKERVDELEKMTKQLESEKDDKENQNKNLQQQVNKLQKDIESIAKEFDESTAKYNNSDMLSQEQDKKINELENALIEFKSNDDSANSPALSNLTAVNDVLRKTNENLNLKILQAQSRMKVLTQRIVSLELDLKKLQFVSKDDVTGKSVIQFKERIADLESEKEGLEQANASFREERTKLDQKIESLLLQLKLAGDDGNKVAAQFYELNGKIIGLENEFANLNQKSEKENLEMQKEIVRLLKVNEQLEKEMKQAGIKPKVQTNTKLENVPQRAQSLDNLIHSKLLQQESTITQQNNLIKSLQERVIELELRNDSESIHELNISGGGMFATDLDAVGGFRASTMSNTSNMSNVSETTKKKRPCVPAAVANMPLSPPPTPPPSLPLPALPGTGINYGSRSSTPGCVSPPPRNHSSASRPESRLGLADLANSSAVELTVEIHKLHRKITKMEDESLENRQIVESLENSLSENETNLRVAKQQLQVLQRDKMELLDQIKRLRSQLDETTTQFENAKSSVQEEKKVIETVLEEERRAKESAEKARRQLENRMEELIAKKSKFMCF